MAKTIEQLEADLEEVQKTLREMTFALRVLDNHCRMLQDIVMRLATEDRQ